MPFVTQDHRDKPDCSIPGDICYVFYKKMVDKWKKEPRWTTAHKIYAQVRLAEELCHDRMVIDTCDNCTARSLAWQVFFQIYVMEYEQRKRKENGDI